LGHQCASPPAVNLSKQVTHKPFLPMGIHMPFPNQRQNHQHCAHAIGLGSLSELSCELRLQTRRSEDATIKLRLRRRRSTRARSANIHGERASPTYAIQESSSRIHAAATVAIPPAGGRPSCSHMWRSSSRMGDCVGDKSTNMHPRLPHPFSARRRWTVGSKARRRIGDVVRHDSGLF